MVTQNHYLRDEPSPRAKRYDLEQTLYLISRDAALPRGVEVRRWCQPGRADREDMASSTSGRGTLDRSDVLAIS